MMIAAPVVNFVNYPADDTLLYISIIDIHMSYNSLTALQDKLSKR